MVTNPITLDQTRLSARPSAPRARPLGLESSSSYHIAQYCRVDGCLPTLTYLSETCREASKAQPISISFRNNMDERETLIASLPRVRLDVRRQLVYSPCRQLHATSISGSNHPGRRFFPQMVTTESDTAIHDVVDAARWLRSTELHSLVLHINTIVVESSFPS